MPRDTLTRDQIAAAAVELLDARGLEGLSMRALGQRLGSAATAVYWHVAGRDDLIVLAADRAWQEVALPRQDPRDWRVAAARMAIDLHAMLVRHPWLVQAFGAHPFFGPAKARHDEHALGLYTAAGFPGAQAERAAAAVFTFVLGNALGPASAASLARRQDRAGSGGDGDAQQALRAAAAKARGAAAQHLRLRARLDTPAASGIGAPEQTFELGLRALLDGLEAQRVAIRQESGDRT